jgi:hypothetical protein
MSDIIEYVDSLTIWLDKELSTLPPKEVQITVMDKKPFKRTLCSALRDIYHSSEDPETKELSLKGMVYAKLLVGRLVQYRKVCENRSVVEYDAELDNFRLRRVLKKELKNKVNKSQRAHFNIKGDSIFGICEEIKKRKQDDQKILDLVEEVFHGVRKIALKILYYRKQGINL